MFLTGSPDRHRMQRMQLAALVKRTRAALENEQKLQPADRKEAEALLQKAAEAMAK
jgi:hypothetical protein